MAYKPHLDKLWETCPHTELRAHGLAVGLPTDGDMGNSEVGHNAIGSGQIYSQGAKLVNENIGIRRNVRIRCMERTRKQRKGTSIPPCISLAFFRTATFIPISII